MAPIDSLLFEVPIHKQSRHFNEDLGRRPSTHGFILGKLDDEINRDMERFLKGRFCLTTVPQGSPTLFGVSLVDKLKNKTLILHFFEAPKGAHPFF